AGRAINSARAHTYDQLTIGAANRALSHIGQELPAEMTGRAAITEMGDRISNGYNAVLPHVIWQSDPNFATGIQIARQSNHLTPQADAQFQQIMRDALGPRVQAVMPPTGGAPIATMNGNLYKEADSILGRQAANFSGSTDPNDRNLGRALQDAQAELRSSLSRSNPQYATQIDNLNSAWADAVRVERAAGMQGAINGRISPANLSSAVKATDNSVRDRAFSRGQ